MLQVSEAAINALQDARAAQDLSEDFGVRVFGESAPSGEIEVSIAFTEEPADGDTVTEQAGTPIYIAPEVAEPLAEAELDLAETPEGPGLVIKPQDAEA